jgi:hypothetical protein
MRIKPQSISEQLMYTTTRLVVGNSIGTGFFFNFRLSDNVKVPVLITNKHVINNEQHPSVEFLLHLDNGNEDCYLNHKITLQTEWHFHPVDDLCFCFINPILQIVKNQTGKAVFYKGAEDEIIATQDKLDNLSAIEEVTMVGYPIGLWDELNNFPIFRRGYTASHPAIDFNKQNIGLVDMACYPGSSGSPIFILNENIYSDKQGNAYLGSRLLFLGVQVAVPQMPVHGKIEVVNTPTQQSVITESMSTVNLGYYIKAKEILGFKPVIEQAIKQQGLPRSIQ